VTINFTNATPNTTYNLVGGHQAWLEITDPCTGCQYVDYYDYDAYASLGIDVPYEEEFDPQRSPRSSPSSIPLGSTYSSAQAKTPSQCGDQRDQIITEYQTYKAGYAPTCSNFTQTASTAHFTFAQLNTGDYSWAILQSYFLTDIETFRTQNGNAAPAVNSAYRNPKHNASVGGKPNGRHIFGDAIDFVSNSSTWQGLHNVGKLPSVGGCVEPIASQGNSYTHCHVDWRGTCPKNW
jgi:hypothetical protein